MKSKTPRQIFSTDLSTQKQELQNNYLLKRFTTSRKNKENDPYRPFYHFSPPENGLNDPNGLCYWRGKWHLFYQGQPDEGRVHWGHAISEDLIHWQDLPYALYPESENDCYSGTCFVEEDRVIAAYYGDQGQAGLMIAVSNDSLLLNWEVVTGKAVVPNVDYDELGRPYQIYDPCIWKDGDFYYVLCGGWADAINPLAEPHANNKIECLDATTCRMVDHIFRSKDLENWIYMGEFMERNVFGYSGDDGSCPYFWPIGDKYILLTFSHVHSGMYVIGDYDKARQKFIALRGGYFNSGRQGSGSIHAPSAYPDGADGVYCIYNVTEGRIQDGWSQIMSLPRRYSLGEANRLKITPAGDLESLRNEALELNDIVLPAFEEIVLEEIRGNSMEILAVIEPGEAKYIRINVLRATDKSEYTAVNFHREIGKDYANRSWNVRDSMITIDPTFSTIDTAVDINEPQSCHFHYNEGNPLELRIFIDRSIIEVFVNKQNACLTRVYPANSDSIGFSIEARGRYARCKKLQAWSMNRIFL